jgi:hypothetical protein
MLPLLGSKRPLIRLNSVPLPAPFGPITATRSSDREINASMISVLPKRW